MLNFIATFHLILFLQDISLEKIANKILFKMSFILFMTYKVLSSDKIYEKQNYYYKTKQTKCYKAHSGKREKKKNEKFTHKKDDVLLFVHKCM